jgi:hypothetical protein
MRRSRLPQRSECEHGVITLAAGSRIVNETVGQSDETLKRTEFNFTRSENIFAKN